MPFWAFYRLLPPEYQSLDEQLDQLGDYLAVMEDRGERLAREAQQLLEEVRESRREAAAEQSNAKPAELEEDI